MQKKSKEFFDYFMKSGQVEQDFLQDKKAAAIHMREQGLQYVQFAEDENRKSEHSKVDSMHTSSVNQSNMLAR
jgi:hypothetical protein